MHPEQFAIRSTDPPKEIQNSQGVQVVHGFFHMLVDLTIRLPCRLERIVKQHLAARRHLLRRRRRIESPVLVMNDLQRRRTRLLDHPVDRPARIALPRLLTLLQYLPTYLRPPQIIDIRPPQVLQKRPPVFLQQQNPRAVLYNPQSAQHVRSSRDPRLVRSFRTLHISCSTVMINLKYPT